MLVLREFQPGAGGRLGAIRDEPVNLLTGELEQRHNQRQQVALAVTVLAEQDVDPRRQLPPEGAEEIEIGHLEAGEADLLADVRREGQGLLQFEGLCDLPEVDLAAVQRLRDGGETPARARVVRRVLDLRLRSLELGLAPRIAGLRFGVRLDDDVTGRKVKLVVLSRGRTVQRALVNERALRQCARLQRPELKRLKVDGGNRCRLRAWMDVELPVRREEHPACPGAIREPLQRAVGQASIDPGADHVRMDAGKPDLFQHLSARPARFVPQERPPRRCALVDRDGVVAEADRR